MIWLGPGDPLMRIDRGVVCRATRTPDGSATYRAQRTDRGIHLTAWGEGSAWICEHAPALLGLRDEPDAFVPRDVIVSGLWRRELPTYLPQTLRVFESLVPVVLQQLVKFKEALRAYRMIVARWGEPAPGPSGLRLQPTPAWFATVPGYALTPTGVLAKQAATLRELGRVAGRLETLTAMTPADAGRWLRQVRGIGPWSAALATAAALGDPDAVPCGDLYLPGEVGWILARERDADDARMLELLSPFEGHRWRVVDLLRRSPDRPARRAPRRGMRPLPGGRGDRRFWLPRTGG